MNMMNFNGEDENLYKIKVKVNNLDAGETYYWSLKKFSNRCYMFKDLLEKYFDSNKIPKLDRSEDPFWDPPEAK